MDGACRFVARSSLVFIILQSTTIMSFGFMAFEGFFKIVTFHQPGKNTWRQALYFPEGQQFVCKSFVPCPISFFLELAKDWSCSPVSSWQSTHFSQSVSFNSCSWCARLLRICYSVHFGHCLCYQHQPLSLPPPPGSIPFWLALYGTYYIWVTQWLTQLAFAMKIRICKLFYWNPCPWSCIFRHHN